jgi:hypothetical protein
MNAYFEYQQIQTKIYHSHLYWSYFNFRNIFPRIPSGYTILIFENLNVNGIILGICEWYIPQRTYGRYFGNSDTTKVSFDKTAFQVLDSSIALRSDLLNGQNNQITPDSTFDVNERTINEIYLLTVGQNKPTEVNQFAGAILNVASQCPLSGGPAIYRARSLYFLIDPFMSYDDANNCLQQGYLYRKGISARAKSYLYPNPASTEINIIYSISDDAIINILNSMGQVVYSLKLNNETYQTTIDISHYSNGLYSYQIINKNRDLNDSRTFIINK